MEWLKDWIFWVFEFVSNMCFTVGQSLIGTIFSVFPLGEGDWIYSSESPWAGMRSIVDYYIPFTEGVGIAAMLFTFQLLVITVRWVFKFIPGIG